MAMVNPLEIVVGNVRFGLQPILSSLPEVLPKLGWSLHSATPMYTGR
jgi:hypothetical protein